MDPADGVFLDMVGINVWSFIGLNGAAFLGAFVASIAGTAGVEPADVEVTISRRLSAFRRLAESPLSAR